MHTKPTDSSADRPSVELERVVKRFDEVVAVDELTLALEPGEFFTLLGPSGCGKTTTLRMVAGFEEPTSGRILIDGEDVGGVPAHRRPTNTVFQSYALFPHLKVEDNVAYGLKRKRIQREEISRRVQAELERVGLAGEARRRPSQLSGGQQQRVALARALVNLPKVLLLDEPLGALDLKLRKGLQVQLKQIQRDVGITFVYVTHDQEEALTMSDRIAVMNEGRIEQIGSPEDIYERPRTAFVAGFIGVSNLMPAEVVSANGARAEVRLDHGPTVRGAAPPDLRPGQRVHACVRPEKLKLMPAASTASRPGAVGPQEGRASDGNPGVEGQVESTLYIGTATQVVVRVGDGVPLTVLVPNSDEEERRELPAAGSRVRLSWAPEHMHVVQDRIDSAPGANLSEREEPEPSAEPAEAVR